MLKVMIDATPVKPLQSGVGFYVYNLINAIDKLQNESLQQELQLLIAYQPGLKNWLQRNYRIPDILEVYSNLKVIPLPVRLYNLLVKISPQLFATSFESSLQSPDIIHGTNHSVYPCRKSRKIMNIYDLTFMKYPEYVDTVVETYQEQVRRNLKWTDLIITISESSKRDVVEYLNVEPEKVWVTPLASRYYKNYLSAEKINQLEEQTLYDFSRPYLLFVSTIEPRKNVEAILQAFNYLKEKHKIDHNLVLIGKKGWKYEPIFAAIANSPYRNYIYHLDYLSDDEVALFYTKADMLVYPSHYEGFGLPVLEAMIFSTPVITSNTSSLPEVAGDAALLIDPNKPMELAEAILQVINNSANRQELVTKGNERVKLFNWERTAKDTIAAYKSLL
ncbi:MAG: glycosyltransferase family 1 protein [Cyanobacteria bacterium P01_A01_bin.45]